GWEWRYVKRLCHLDLLTYRGHTRAASGAAFSPDGTRVVSGAGNFRWNPRVVQMPGTDLATTGELAVWEAATGREVFGRRGLKGGIQCVTYSPDGTRLASGNLNGQVTVWDAASGHEVFTRSVSGGSVLSVAFSPDGKCVAAGSGVILDGNSNGLCTVWNTATGDEVLQMPGPKGGVESLAFSPQGTWVALAGMEVIELLDLGSHQRV